MARRPTGKEVKRPVAGPPASNPEKAFLSFGNAMHWALYFKNEDFYKDMARTEDDCIDALIN